MWNLNLDLVDRKWQVTLFGMWLLQTPVQAMVLIDNCQLNRRWHVVWGTQSQWLRLQIPSFIENSTSTLFLFQIEAMKCLFELISISLFIHLLFYNELYLSLCTICLCNKMFLKLWNFIINCCNTDRFYDTFNETRFGNTAISTTATT